MFAEKSSAKNLQLALFVLLTVEAFPGAGGLLCAQRSLRNFSQNKWTLLFQDSVDARRQLARDRHNSFARGDFPDRRADRTRAVRDLF
jgi:hypothetical protein